MDIRKKVPEFIKFYDNHEHFIAGTRHQERAVLVSKIDTIVTINTGNSRDSIKAAYFPENITRQVLSFDDREDYDKNKFLCIEYCDELTIIGKVSSDVYEEMKKWIITVNFLIEATIMRKAKEGLWGRLHL